MYKYDALREAVSLSFEMPPLLTFSFSLWLFCLVTKSWPTLCDPMDCSPPGSTVHGILQARIVEWVVISFSRDLPDPGIEPRFSCIGRQILYHLSHPGSPLFCPVTPQMFTHLHFFFSPYKLKLVSLKEKSVAWPQQSHWGEGGLDFCAPHLT